MQLLLEASCCSVQFNFFGMPNFSFGVNLTCYYPLGSQHRCKIFRRVLANLLVTILIMKTLHSIEISPQTEAK